MENKDFSNIKEAFRKDCKVIDLSNEYPGFRETYRFAIVTGLPEKEFETKYECAICELRPYILLTPEMGEIIREFWANEKKYEKRDERGEMEFPCCETKDELSLGLYIRDYEALCEEKAFRAEMIVRIRKAFETLSPEQKSRVVRHYLEDKTLEQIAHEDGVSIKNVSRSIRRARWKFCRFFGVEEVA